MSENLDHFARGELSPAESRDLAQRALNDHDLFDDLTAIAIARRGLAARQRLHVGWPRVAMLTAAAVIVGVVALYTLFRNSEALKPAGRVSGPPTLLARNADSELAAFRGADAVSREPRTTGSITSIDHSATTIDLGSLDGLAKGGEVDVIRDGRVIAQVKLSTVFRDHSRGEIEDSSSIAAHDQVRVPSSAWLRAILDQISAALARGEAEKAISIAQHTPLGIFDAGLQDEEDLNNAGVIAELHGNQTKAGELYHRALQAKPSAQDRQAIEKNLARLKGTQ